MMPEERRQQIIEIVYKEKSATVLQLCERLTASEATIRRDLNILEEENKLERVHGGAIFRANMPIDKEDTFNEKEGTKSIEKKEIAKKAFSLLRDNDSIFIDGGTTTYELAKLIGRSRIKLNVFTNAPHFSKAIALNPKTDQYIIGGKIRNSTLTVVGHTAIETLQRFRLNKAFIGVNGISEEYGYTTPDFDEAETKRAILIRASERYIMADNSKFDRVALCQILPLSAVDGILSNDIDLTWRMRLKEEGVRLLEATFLERSSLS